LADFVERFWSLENSSGENKEVVVIPDGRVDVLFAFAFHETFRSALIGIETKPSEHPLPAGTVMFGMSLNLLGVEYLIDISIADSINQVQLLPDQFWGITREELNDFDAFCRKVSQELTNPLSVNIDNRKRKLFKLIYSSKGALSVQELSDKVY
jgi:hypothetical protein